MKKNYLSIVLLLAFQIILFLKSPAQGCFDIEYCTDDTSCTAGTVWLPYPPFFLPCNTLPGAVLTSNVPDLVDDGLTGAIAENVPAGVYWASFIGQDECGNLDTCTISVTVADCTAPQIDCIPGLVVELIDVNPPAVTLSAAQFIESFTDNCPGTLSFSFFGDAMVPDRTFTCLDAGFLTLEIWGADQLGNTSEPCTTILVIQANDVNCCEGPTGNLTGMVQRDDQLGVENVQVYCANCPQSNVQTNASGEYAFEGLFQNCEYTFVPQKDGDDAKGVTVLDVLKLRKHILGIDPILLPTRILAADLNSNGVVSTFDMVLMVEVILEKDPGFTEVDSWTFNPSFISIASLPVDPAQMAFTGIKMGDVLREEEVPVADVHPVFQVPEVNVNSGGGVIPITVKGFSQIEAFQMSFVWDPAQMEITGLTSVLPNFTGANYYLPEPGRLNVFWVMTDGQQLTLMDGMAIFQFDFFVPGTPPDILFGIDPDHIPLQVIAQGCKLVQDPTITSSHEQPLTEVFRIIPGPNPLMRGTQVDIRVQSAGDLVLQGVLTDAAGKIYSRIERDIPAGLSSLSLQLPDSPGVFFLQLNTSSGVGQTIRFILI